MLVGLQGETVGVDPGRGDVGPVVVGLNKTPVCRRHGPHTVGGVELELRVLERVDTVVVVRPGTAANGRVQGEVGKTVRAVGNVGHGLDDPDDGLGGVREAELLADRAVRVRFTPLILNLFYTENTASFEVFTVLVRL